MKNGISTNRFVTAQATCLKSAGIDFVFRYYSTTTTQPQKRLTLDEANALVAAGLEIGVVYEDKPDELPYFSNARGNRDGKHAYGFAKAIGQPLGSAIYFAVDYDAPTADRTGPVLEYFKGVNQGLQDAGGVVSNYSIGVYGSGAVCKLIKDQSGLAKFSWLAESTGWTGTKTYTSWDVNQAMPTTDVCGFTAQPEQYEENQSQDDFGGFSSLDPLIVT